MKLYSGPLSLFTAKVRVALREKGLAVEVVSVPFSRERAYEPRHPDVLALNPKAQVPVLVDGDLALYDSTLILEYLEDRHPEPPLYPRDPAERARCRQLEAEADELIFPPVWSLIEEVFYQPDPARRDGARVKEATETLARLYDRLDARLEAGGRPELCAGGFSVADIATFLTLSFAATLGAGIPPSRASLQAWFGSMTRRPSLAKEMAEMAAFAADLRAGRTGTS